jgi:superfamily I DNA/RNA helicase/mRNA-degrading endonuclease RelE of RelBE toxin-antitoxin system
MSYELAMKDSFMADFVLLNKDMQKRATSAMKELRQDPVTPRGDTIKRLRHHEKLWRYRLGDFRLVYAAYPSNKLVQMLMIGPRGEVYKRLGYQPESPDYADYSTAFEGALDPNHETPAEWVQYLTPPKPVDESKALPYLLTSKLLEAWRIPSEYHARLVECKTEDRLQECEVPAEVLLHLMNCLWPANASTVSQSPNRLVVKPEDLECYASGDLMSFLLLLDDEQKKLVDFSLSGPTLVKGGPGSGKSTVALYRVQSLVKQHSKDHRKVHVLFTTYTNALIEASRQLLDRLLENIPPSSVELEVSTLDRIAMQIVSSREAKPSMPGDWDTKSALTSARAAFKNAANIIDDYGPSDLMILAALEDLRDDYLKEEMEWIIEGQNLSSLEDYLALDRTGRGYSFNPRLRKFVWTFYEFYRGFFHQLGKITWGELRQRALALVRSGEWKDRFDYVLVDEAQDLTPAALSLALELCKDPKGLFLTADACQSLYNRGFAWKRVHESLRIAGRTRLLKRNYRTTRQIVNAAVGLLRNSDAGDADAMDQIFVHVGPPPKVYEAMDNSDMFLWLAQQLQSSARELRMPVGSIAVLAPTNDLAQQAADRLASIGLPTDYMTGRDLDLGSPHAKALTIHSAKGLEFPILAIPFVEEGILPHPLPDERAEDLQKHLDHELRVLFTGCTRAMRRLFLAYRQGTPSRFLQNLEPGMWEIEKFA